MIGLGMYYEASIKIERGQTRGKIAIPYLGEPHILVNLIFFFTLICSFKSRAYCEDDWRQFVGEVVIAEGHLNHKSTHMYIGTRYCHELGFRIK